MRRVERGFTIVELLIVVVVIAILAAITIVAYNGIQNRAKSSAAQTAASQAAKKVATYAVTNSDNYPATLDAAGIVTTGSTTYDYFIDSTARKYCVSSTASAISFAQTQASGSGVNGKCMMNYVVNPSAEGSTNLTVSAGAPLLTISTDTFSGWPTSGSRSFKVEATSAGETRPRVQNNAIPVVATEPIQASFYVRNAAASAKSFFVSFQGRTSGGSAVGVYTTSDISIPAGGIARVTGVLPTDQYASTFSTAAYIEPMISRRATGGAVGDIFYVDDILVSYGSTFSSYADGTSANWTWFGSNSDSASFGPNQ